MDTHREESKEGLKNLREIREIAGLNQQQLANLVPIAHGTVRGIETGHKAFSGDLVEKIARTVGCGMRRKGDTWELTLTQIGSTKTYTREWFLRWNEIHMRRRAYGRFLQHYSGLITDIMEAACEIDLEQESGSNERAPNSLADSVAGQLINELPKILGDKDLLEKLDVVYKRSLRLRYMGGPVKTDHIISGLEADIVEGKKKAEAMKARIERNG